MCFLKLNFQLKDHLHNNCLFYILTIYCKYLPFSLSLALQLRIPNLAGVQNGRTISSKNQCFDKKCFLLRLISKIAVIFMPITCFTFSLFIAFAFIFYAISSLLNVNLFLFQFLSHDILMHIPILTGVQIGRISR